MNFLKNWWSFTKSTRMRSAIIVNMVIVVAGLIAETVGIKLFQYIVDIMPKGKHDFIMLLFGVYVLTCIIYAVCFYSKQVTRANLRESTIQKVRAEFSLHVTKISASDLTELPQNEITTVDELIDGLVDGAHFIMSEQLTTLVANTILSFGLMLLTNWKLSIILFMVSFPIGMTMIKLGKKFEPLTHKRIEARKKLRGMVNRLNFFTTIKSFSREKYENNLINTASVSYKEAGIERKALNRNYVLLTIICNIILAIVILAVGIYTVPKGLLTAGELMLFYLLRNELMAPFEILIDTIDQISVWEGNFIKYDKLMKLPEEEDGELKLISFDNDIRLDDVSFAYESNNFVLQNINLTIQKGQKIGIYGPSGGGKSSLIKLINRLYRVNSGAIYIDSININDITSDSLRRKIGVVSQAVEIFDGSIKDNILYGTKATEEQMLSASRKAFAHEFVSKLGDGYDTIVGRNGIQLSGGERQRIALARVFLADPDILILDEATSALDNDSEKVVQRAIEAVEKDNKTVIAIAHRISTIKNYDMLYGIDNHKIVECGTSEELLQDKNSIWSRYNALAED